MGGDWGIYIFGFLMTAIVMIRLNRLGKQIEAVDVSIRADIARTEPLLPDACTQWLSDFIELYEDRVKQTITNLYEVRRDEAAQSVQAGETQSPASSNSDAVPPIFQTGAVVTVWCVS